MLPHISYFPASNLNATLIFTWLWERFSYRQLHRESATHSSSPRCIFSAVFKYQAQYLMKHSRQSPFPAPRPSEISRPRYVSQLPVSTLPRRTRRPEVPSRSCSCYTMFVCSRAIQALVRHTGIYRVIRERMSIPRVTNTFMQVVLWRKCLWFMLIAAIFWRLSLR